MDMISIVVPIYNVEQYLVECVNSLIHQTYKNIEIILVDDGSTDSSGAICDEYACKDERIRVIHKQNGGLSDARNVGIDIARGDYIGFVDSDDYVEHNMYEHLLLACKENLCDIAVCARDNFDENGGHNIMFCVNEPVIYDDESAIEEILLNRNMDSAAWDKLYKRELFVGIRYPIGVLHEDLDVTSRVISKTSKIVQIPEILYKYRIRNGSITKQGFKPKKMDMLLQTEKLCEFVLEKYPKLAWQSSKFMCFNITNLLTLLLKTGKKEYIEEKKQIIPKGWFNLKKNMKNPYLSQKDKIRLLVKLIKIQL
ncbi:MAG: glycosyltransferase [Eubacterium sp.]|nr:glycosyltransferase [Eubacterium sp.]